MNKELGKKIFKLLLTTALEKTEFQSFGFFLLLFCLRSFRLDCGSENIAAICISTFSFLAQENLGDGGEL